MLFRRLPTLPKDRIKELLEFEKKVGVKFKNLELLHQSLIHSSYTKYNSLPSIMSNERLEFVGDAVITMVISKYLYKKYTNYDEGALSGIKSDVVSRKIMSEIGKSIGLDKYILSFPPLNKFDERGRNTIISNAFEAFIGAIFISNGIEPAEKIILKLFSSVIEDRIKNGTYDYKSILQTYAINIYNGYPEYSVIDERGPNHRKEFIVKVSVNGKILGEGKGFSKKEAEQSAAQKALENIKQIPY